MESALAVVWRWWLVLWPHVLAASVLAINLAASAHAHALAVLLPPASSSGGPASEQLIVAQAPGGARSGPLVITVDVQARTISVFRDGHEIGAAAILRGYGYKPTPTGVFPITQKDADHVSTIYDAPMPYMLRLTNDGVSIHGSKVERGYATNGCIGVPNDFAKRLFAQASLGDKVIITDGKRIGVGDPILPGG
jgi:hypothetical protein